MDSCFIYCHILTQTTYSTVNLWTHVWRYDPEMLYDIRFPSLTAAILPNGNRFNSGVTHFGLCCDPVTLYDIRFPYLTAAILPNGNRFNSGVM